MSLCASAFLLLAAACSSDADSFVESEGGREYTSETGSVSPSATEGETAGAVGGSTNSGVGGESAAASANTGAATGSATETAHPLDKKRMSMNLQSSMCGPTSTASVIACSEWTTHDEYYDYKLRANRTDFSFSVDVKGSPTTLYLSGTSGPCSEALVSSSIYTVEIENDGIHCFDVPLTPNSGMSHLSLSFDHEDSVEWSASFCSTACGGQGAQQASDPYEFQSLYGDFSSCQSFESTTTEDGCKVEATCFIDEGFSIVCDGESEDEEGNEPLSGCDCTHGANKVPLGTPFMTEGEQPACLQALERCITLTTPN